MENELDNESLLLRLDSLLDQIFKSAGNIEYNVSYYEDHEFPYELSFDYEKGSSVKEFLRELSSLTQQYNLGETHTSFLFKDIRGFIEFLTDLVVNSLGVSEGGETSEEDYSYSDPKYSVPEDLSDLEELKDSSKEKSKGKPKKSTKQERVKTTVKGDGTVLTLSRPGKDIDSLESIANDLLNELLNSPNMSKFSKLTKIININMF